MTSHQCQGYKEKTCKKSKRYLNKRRSSKQIGEPTEESNILLRRTAVPKCDITPAVKGLMTFLHLLCDFRLKRDKTKFTSFS